MGDRERTQQKLDPFLKTMTRPSNTSNNQQQTPVQSPGADAKSSHQTNFPDNQPGTSSQSQDPHIKKEEHDESHSFQYRFNSKSERFLITCCHYGTVLDSLQTSNIFNDMTKKEQRKEIVIQREEIPKPAVSTHFPCHLIDNNELVTVSFIKGLNGSSSDTQGRSKQSNPQKRQPDKLMAFCVETEGGQGIKKKVMKNPELRKKVKCVCVYGYKGETVDHALTRDGRFDKTIFTDCVLSEPETANTEISQPVDGLDRKMLVVKVKRIGRVSQPQPDSLEDWDNTPTEEPSVPPGGTKEAALSPQSPTTPDTVKTQLQTNEAGKDGSSQVVKQKRQEIPDSKEILNILRSQYAGLVDHMKDRENLKKPSDVQQFFRVEFGKKTQSFQEVKKVKRLIELSASVCQVRIGGTATGTGFLLFDKFILTNAHVVQQIYEQITNTLQQSVTVTFDFEDLDEKTQPIPVNSEVVVYEKECYVDFALLELRADPDITLPSSLLDTFSFPSPEGGICIIGHPDGGVKKTDPCFIIQYEDRKQAVEKHVTENKEFLHVINNRYFEENWDINTHLLRDTERITYDTCFFHGASGSPVFNEYCQLTAMHTGGYSYQVKGGNTQSLIEYAIPLSGILEKIIIQAVRRKRVDVLQGFLSRRRLTLDVVLERVKTQSDNASLVKAFQEKLPFNSNTSATDQGEQRTFHQFLFDKGDATGVEAMEVDDDQWWKKCPVVILK